MDITVYRETLDGYKYMFSEFTIFGHTSVLTYCYFDYNKRYNRICKDFESMEEALAWCDKKDADFLRPKVESKPQIINLPDDYYNRPAGTYYGD